jgi:putative endonuclease
MEKKYRYVYVLRSLKDNCLYVGFTKDLSARVQAHNSGAIPSTRRRIPFELVYWEGCLNQADATKREKYLKSAWGKRYLKNRLRSYLTG